MRIQLTKEQINVAIADFVMVHAPHLIRGLGDGSPYFYLVQSHPSRQGQVFEVDVNLKEEKRLA